MNAPDRPPRDELGLERFFSLTLGNISNCYVALNPGRQLVDFIPDILTVVGARDDPSAETPLEIIMQFASPADKAKGEDAIASSPNGALIVSCTYCLRAMRAMKSGELDLAWSYMADARYWSGVAICGKGIADARELASAEISTEVLAAKARSGAQARNAAYGPVRERAYQLARERRPASGWRSRSHAVKVISNEAHQFSLVNGPALKEESLSKTLDGWLKDMPDASTLFPRKPKKA